MLLIISTAKVQQLFHTAKYFMLNNVKHKNQYETESTDIISSFQGNNLTEINNLDRSGFDVQTLGSTVSGQTPNQDPDPEFNFCEINTLDRSVASSLLPHLKNGNKKG